MRRFRVTCALIVTGLVSMVAATAADAVAAHARLIVGLDDSGAFTLASPSASEAWQSRASRSGAEMIRVIINWSTVAPLVRPHGFRAADPGSRGYSWSSVDAAVRPLLSRGFQVVLLVLGAPRWAEGPRRPSDAAPGSWRPDPAQLGLFARAAALRYSGHYSERAGAGILPRVRYWEAWNEPNLPIYLMPQWTHRGGGYVPASPVQYRRMLNAFYAAVKQVARTNVVIAGGTAPFGEPQPGGSRMPPVWFWQALLCVRGSTLQAVRCGRAHFDVLDHHPYDLGGPLAPAAQPADVSIPDMGKLTRLLRAAAREHTILPAGSKQVWTTEIAWSSRPPDPSGVPLERQARWLEQAMFVLWSQGISAVFWLQINDPMTTAPATALDAGLYFQDGRPKPAATAFRFPFVTTREGGAGGRRILAWGRAPATGAVRIEMLVGHRWAVLRRVQARRFQVFELSIRSAQPATLRAQIGRLTSLSWHQP